ncbi:MAG: hypothetical protein CM15mP55_0920 [Hyphomicrobiales bacterium]|nr:MAG: hypothetical protein CM15mP55_0920 [Hyphomicrobiales bacterium]
MTVAHELLRTWLCRWSATPRRNCPDGDAGDNLFRITSLGFRGEALPSIGAVSKMTITTRTADAPEASTLTVAGGVAGDMRPAAGTGGTRIEVRDLFAVTRRRACTSEIGARRNDGREDTLKRLAMAHACIGSGLTNDGETEFSAPAETGRCGPAQQVVGHYGQGVW